MHRIQGAVNLLYRKNRYKNFEKRRIHVRISITEPFFPSFQFLVYPSRISAKIQNCKNLGGSGRFAVVDSEWKSFREQAMEPKMFGMDSVEQAQAFYVG